MHRYTCLSTLPAAYRTQRSVEGQKHVVKGRWKRPHVGQALRQTCSRNATPVLMGKQAEGHAQKALDSPCAALYQASLKCESGWPRWIKHHSQSSLRFRVRPPDIAVVATPAGLDRNQYNRDKCQDAFTAYKDCKKQEVVP